MAATVSFESTPLPERQHQPETIRASGSGGSDRPASRAEWHESGLRGSRDYRNHRNGRRGEIRRYALGIEGTGRWIGYRRLRHRLLVAKPPAEFPGRYPEDRPHLCLPNGWKRRRNLICSESSGASAPKVTYSPNRSTTGRF